ncbi:MAG: Rrf2 family transcriptional regulator [Bryobacteraceae bacterium]
MLKLTKKADYGLIALRHLAQTGRRPETGVWTSASAKDIADAYGIPLPLLSKVLQRLAKSGMLASEQGTNGGYRLAKDASQISTLEVIRAIDGPIILTQCFTEHSGCSRTELCPVREPLRKVHEGILGLLSSITLADLANDDMPVPVFRPSLTKITMPSVEAAGMEIASS